MCCVSNFIVTGLSDVPQIPLQILSPVKAPVLQCVLLTLLSPFSLASIVSQIFPALSNLSLSYLSLPITHGPLRLLF